QTCSACHTRFRAE
ncbi:MAG: hypothetical protein GTN65_07315, partial [Armatimonadetes bacterium]|nr:hypothetical protein [Armatimonadota bacterium]NIO96892.1 hypothetical protein [Armatimonadota bacterium]